MTTGWEQWFLECQAQKIIVYILWRLLWTERRMFKNDQSTVGLYIGVLLSLSDRFPNPVTLVMMPFLKLTFVKSPLFNKAPGNQIWATWTAKCTWQDSSASRALSIKAWWHAVRQTIPANSPAISLSSAFVPACKVCTVSVPNITNNYQTLNNSSIGIIHWRPFPLGWRPSLVGWRPFLHWLVSLPSCILASLGAFLAVHLPVLKESA